jgi:hypothetical protein
MAAALLGEALKSAWGAQGSGEGSTPNVSPGLDPGRYAFELFWKSLQDREAKRKFEEQMQEKRREFDAANVAQRSENNQKVQAQGMDFLNQGLARAQKNANTDVFHQGLYSGMIGGSNGNG